MPDAAHPYDPNYTSFVFGDTPGAADFDRLQTNLAFVSSMPNAKLSRDTDQLVNSSATFTTVQWSHNYQTTDPNMIVFSSGFTDRILLPYVGDYEVGCAIRTQYNNAGGGAFQAAEIQLFKTYASGHADVQIDQDIQPIPTSITVPLNLRCGTLMKIASNEIANTPALYVKYSQLSGGVASIKAAGSGNAFCYPIMWARWVGTSAV